jgi:hypothetical protein
MPPPTPKKSKSTAARTEDPEPMKGLTPPKPGYVTPKKDDEDYSPAKEVDLGEDLSAEKKGEMAEVGSRQEKFESDIGKAAMGKGRKSRKHKKSKKSRKTRKTKKHGKRRH